MAAVGKPDALPFSEYSQSPSAAGQGGKGSSSIRAAASGFLASAGTSAVQSSQRMPLQAHLTAPAAAAASVPDFPAQGIHPELNGVQIPGGLLLAALFPQLQLLDVTLDPAAADDAMQAAAQLLPAVGSPQPVQVQLQVQIVSGDESLPTGGHAASAAFTTDGLLNVELWAQFKSSGSTGTGSSRTAPTRPERYRCTAEC
jgi:hypothetical protein